MVYRYAMPHAPPYVADLRQIVNAVVYLLRLAVDLTWTKLGREPATIRA